jgi:hypothetical protein
MSRIERTFEHKVGDYKKNLKVPIEETKTPFGKGVEGYDKNIKPTDKIEEHYGQFGEREKDEKYENIRKRIREMKRGDVDMHLGKIDEDELPLEALDLFDKHEHKKLHEDEVTLFTSKYEIGSNEQVFGALLRTWILDKKSIDAEKEKGRLKEEARQKLDELRRKNEQNPHVVSHVDNINISSLRWLDLKTVNNIEHVNMGAYKNNLKEYFGNRIMGKQGREVTIIEEDPRFRFYCSLKGILNLGPGSPDEFLNN